MGDLFIQAECSMIVGDPRTSVVNTYFATIIVLPNVGQMFMGGKEHNYYGCSRHISVARRKGKNDVMAIVARKGCSCNYYHVGDSIERLCVVSAIHFRL